MRTAKNLVTRWLIVPVVVFVLPALLMACPSNLPD